MTRKELSQLYYLNREIQWDKEKLAELEATATSITPKISGMPHAQGVGNKTAIGGDIADLRRAIENRQAVMIAEYNRLDSYISTIADSQVRMIMKLRHLELMSWNEVADVIGGGSTENSVRVLHNRFLRKF